LKERPPNSQIIPSFSSEIDRRIYIYADVLSINNMPRTHIILFNYNLIDYILA